ncbi:FlaA1/EpsC-like NDP-sugar epimerase [Natronospira proteinivora]|uniref:FlaA1/EpsC-like NDP-sugar epimerase n=1 Tax=Natronospira proteinivora TaxID=1807133 RepID=A0ABT1G9B0_9GAMM|nr:nucleoside-diphosphate sugar epimerase/dehydratase [Natronospira proteinivora]MCP1727910.1 FlaA1/EpsC-like NDP-sugar epimerase [Natronospira proteinivora]
MNDMQRTLQWRRPLVVLHDLLWIPVAIIMAYWMRFNLDTIPAEFHTSILVLIGVAVPIHAASYWYFGCYRGVWRFASMPDLFRLSKAIVVGALLAVTVVFLYDRLAGVPRSVVFLYPLFLIVATGGARAAYRVYKEFYLSRLRDPNVQRMIVVGAGTDGEHLVRGLRSRHDVLPIGLVDDDPIKWGTEIYGVRVLGPISQLAEICRRYHVDNVILAISSASREAFSRVLSQTNEVGVPCQISSALSEHDSILGGLRPVTTEDVLGRDPVTLDEPAISATFRGKTVLVTGGGGSIGLELCRRVLGHQPARLLLLDLSEYNLYRAEQILMPEAGATRIEFILGNVCDRSHMQGLFGKHRPDIVLHAAAYKHVPLLESNVLAALCNNVQGTRVVAETAAQFEAGKFVLVSTDKTVNPTNVMGASKRVAELICRDLHERHSATDYLITRFGNVLGSAGSVIPLFERQIAEGGPVTVTHPEVKRFFMTVEEATGLITQAAALSRGGEVYVLEMGQPVLIRELAENMIRLSGLKPHKDIEITYTGLRPGEKLEEELFYDSENLHGTAHSKLMLADCGDDLCPKLPEYLQALDIALAEGDEARAIALLKDLVPAFNRFIPETDPGDPTPLRIVK